MKKIIGLGIIGFILVVGSISVGAASTVPSDGVLYSDSGKTVKEALDELFTELGNLKKIGTASEADILQDKTALVQGIEIKGQMANNGYGSIVPLDRVILWDNYVYYRIPSGFYSINTSHGLSEVKASYSDVATAIGLTAAKLAKGQTVLGVSGTYTSDATASAANILSGKTAYINGSKTTGTMANNGALNWSPSTSSSKTIAAGYYSGGTISTANAYNAGYNAAKATFTIPGKSYSGTLSTSKSMTVSNTINLSNFKTMTIPAYSGKTGTKDIIIDANTITLTYSDGSTASKTFSTSTQENVDITGATSITYKITGRHHSAYGYAYSFKVGDFIFSS